MADNEELEELRRRVRAQEAEREAEMDELRRRLQPPQERQREAHRATRAKLDSPLPPTPWQRAGRKGPGDTRGS